MDTFDTWQGTEPLLFINWNLTPLYAQKVHLYQFVVFALVILWSYVKIEIPYPTLFLLRCRIPTPRKREIPLPLVIEIPASRACFQLASRISPWKKGKSRIPPNLLWTLYRGNPRYGYDFHSQFPINKTMTKESKRTKTKTFVSVVALKRAVLNGSTKSRFKF
jgi:hypothetical protein